MEVGLCHILSLYIGYEPVWLYEHPEVMK